MLKAVTIAVVMLVAAVLIYVAITPDTFRIARATSIKAPPEKIFPFINDLHRHASWGPWETLDPAMRRTYSGSAAGKGAVYEWEGDSSVGKGRVEITKSSSPLQVTMKLDYVKPFEAHNTVVFTLDAEGNATKVTWDLHGTNTFITKLVSILFSERMVGGMFEQGLAKLKAVAES